LERNGEYEKADSFKTLVEGSFCKWTTHNIAEREHFHENENDFVYISLGFQYVHLEKFQLGNLKGRDHFDNINLDWGEEYENKT
jgi:hypothetical protein